jgi:Uma2 family endonuclease
VIEVVSSGSAIYDRNAKADTCGALGVTELWLVEDTREQIEVRIQIVSKVLPPIWRCSPLDYLRIEGQAARFRRQSSK